MRELTPISHRKDQYFKIVSNKREWLGVRYFRFNMNSDKTIQVCTSVGETKKGKSNTFGVYLISRLTFMTNYYSMGYVEVITKREFDKQFKNVIDMLS
jgi:hypothetical protein